MSKAKGTGGVLIVSASESVFTTMKRLLAGSPYAPVVFAPSITKARQMMAAGSFDVVVIYTPLKEEFGVETALDFVSRRSMGVVLMVKPEIYGQVRSKVSGSGIAVLSKRIDADLFLQSVDIVAQAQIKTRKLEEDLERIRRKLDDLSQLSRAKCLLIEHKHMHEEEAHEYIVKEAMQSGRTRKAVAEDIISRFSR